VSQTNPKKKMKTKITGKMKNNKPINKKEWTPPKLWQGSTCYILGGGPSLLNVNFDLIKGSRIIAVNNAYGNPVAKLNGELSHYEPRNWVDVCWFGDGQWYWWHKPWLKAFSGILATCKDTFYGVTGVKTLKRSRKTYGIEEKPGQVCWNLNSGASAINLAYHLGVKRIILLGFDMHNVEKKKNWHNDHKTNVTNINNIYNRHLKSFPIIMKDAERLGLEIINCTPNSAITEIPIQELEKVVANA